ncbi:tannase [Sclerotinia borealis F-4128]|uniref:Carboxylic ester hydrolase n=1 Tax=Sclerotinia borealis (strain F-4128) TaxID=1432307 RepID=W9CLR8_SCLBF|nr:tannase [Sclerotinia borealis F-4128]
MPSIIGTPYYCAVEKYTSLGLGFGKRRASGSETSSTPAQNGTVSAEAVDVAQTILGVEFSDAQTSYDNATGAWGLDIAGAGGEWVARFIELNDATNLDTLDGVTYDTLVQWMTEGMTLYYHSLQTTISDLTTIMSFNESSAALSEWYKFYLVPGAAHCATNPLEPNTPFPQTNLTVMVYWVENGNAPVTLNATVLNRDYKGDNGQICAWPLRPMWTGNETLEC